MQPPPQARHPGTGGPPRMGLGNNAHWRKRGPNPVPVASASVQPVTDPFAFGRITPQSMAQGNVLIGNPLMAPSVSPSFYPQPVPVHASAAVDQGHGSPASLPGFVPQPAATGGMYTNVSVPSPSSAPFHNYPAATSSAQPGLSNIQTFQNTASGLENAFLPVHIRAQSTQGINYNPPSSSPLQHFIPAPSQPTNAPSGSLQSVPPASAQNFPLPVQQPSHNAPYYSPPYLEVSNLVPQANETVAQQRSAPGHYPPATVANPTFQHSTSQPTILNPIDYMHRHNPDQNWVKQPHKDQQHPPFPSPNPVQYPTQPPEPHQEVTNASGHVSTNVDSGTISMFFKGDEEENVEIVSSDQQNASVKVDHGSSHYQNSGHEGVPSLLPQPTVSSMSSLTPISVSQNVGNLTQPHSDWRQDVFPVGDKISKPKVGSELPYDNVENIECVQNQEVPPNEPNHFNLYPSNVNSDTYRYGSMPGLSLQKNVSSQPEAGPNLETPVTVGCPVRSDSVSSNYSNLSHKSLPVPTRPQELAGTFIQKERGRLEGDSSHGFFKQIDSLPMAGDAVGQNMGQHTFHSNLSQPPTPSPPKPTGIFMTSANSSFEPVRSHSIGLKASDVDQLKMGGDLREGHNVPPSASLPAASPGNLEQPPDNLESIFLGKRNSHGNITSNGNLFHSAGDPPLDNISLLLERRPSSRAHGSNKKCESPATTLWAQGELPNFGGNVLLAPAAPSLYVPPKPQTEIIQPPEDGSYDSCSGGTDMGKFQTSLEEQISSENLENPPKITDEEQLPSQASSGYASLLSSPPTEVLQNQPLLIAQPNKTYNLSQPNNFSLSLPNKVKNINSLKELGAADKPGPQSLPPAVGNFNSNDNTVFSLIQVPPEASNPPNYKSAATNDKFSESLHNLSSILQRQSSANQMPLNLAAESQKALKGENATVDLANKNQIPAALPTGPRFPANPNGKPNYHAEKTGALDFTVPHAPVSSVANNVASSNSQPVAGGPLFPRPSVSYQNGQAGLDVNKHGFYQQVTKDGPPQQQPVMDIQHQGGVGLGEYMVPSSQPLSLVLPAQAPPVGKSVPYPPQAESQVQTLQNPSGTPYNSAPEPAPKYGPTEQPSYPAPPVPSSSATVNHIATYQEQPRPPASHTPQQADPYYYRSYGAYPQPYQPLDPRAAPLYYPDPYGAYDPTYRQYSGSAYVNPGNYSYQEPERPSSRSSHCSDRPSSRQGYSSKGDWNAHSGYYSGYYQSQYDYADPSRWDRYPGAYDPGYRDPSSNYWNYMYNSRDDVYQRNVPTAYTTRYDVYEDRWQYDPRYVGGFDEEPQRDLTKDDFDRRSVHSEHSVHSMHSGRSAHSRRSSFSSHSQHSQIYKSQPDLSANAYEPQIQNPPLNEYSYGVYPNDYGTQQALDDYSYGYPKGTEWQPVEQVPSRPLTPEKFGSPHICARFGSGGQLIKVLPNLPSDGQPALVEIHNMEVIMQNSAEQEQLRSFPGPLVKDETHKVDVISFAQKKFKECSQNESLLDQESACLLWDFIVLLCRQNGTVVGTDIAELLLRDHKTVWLPAKSPNEANLIDFSNEPLEQQEEESGASQLSFLTDSLQSTGEALEKETERFRELLLFGRKKDALESAMKNGLWGHALLLASKMDSRTHARVMTRFANSLPINDPLQTVYQLLSGRMPAAATCCGDEKWGDWRPHLAMVLSNLTNNVDVPTRAMTTMGDTLASRGLMDASHFCYLMAQVGFGIFTKKSTKLVLIGSNHSLSFAKFCTNEAIQRTEAYEYAQALGTQSFSLPNIQVYKFIYACRLAEHGLSAQAFHYCEVISKTILKHPSCYSPVLVSQLLEVSSHLRFFDPQLKEKPEQELFIDPPWLQHLRTLDKQMKHGTVVYDMGRTTPQQFACSTPSSEIDHVSQSDGFGIAGDIPTHTENPLLANLLPNMMPPVQAVLVPAGPENPPPVYPPYTGNDPSYPGTPQGLAPSSGPPTPSTAPNFVPFGVEQATVYPPAALQPYPPLPQATDCAPPMQMNQDPGLQRIQQNSPTKTTFADPEDFYGVMAKMVPGQRSRTVSQSSSHMRRTRTTSESSTHSIGSGRRSSMGIQPSPPPASIPEADRPEEKNKHKSHGPSQGSGKSWFPLKFGWLMGKGKNEAHLPDDRNKSIVWDEKQQRWTNLDEPEEERKPLPPPPPGMLKKPQTAPSVPGGPLNPSVNVFSIRAAGARGRYIDVLNPGGTRPTNSVPPPADLFAPLAPMPIPTNLFVPNAVPEEGQPAEASGAEMVQPAGQTGLSNFSQAQLPGLPPVSDLPTNQEDGQMGEAHVAPASGPPPTGAVPFYNPSQFSQQQPPSAQAGGLRPGRLGQRKYPSLK